MTNTPHCMPLINQETYYGLISSVDDAMLVVDAARSLHIPRVRSRLSDRERKSIRSGSVFVFLESESRIRRWTDGKTWSPSRIVGEFLVYRETEGNAVLKEDGLVKRTISLSMGSGEAFHVVAYYREREKNDLISAAKHPFFKLSAPIQGEQLPVGKPMKQSEMTGHFRLSRRNSPASSNRHTRIAPAPFPLSIGVTFNQAADSLDEEGRGDDGLGVLTEDHLLFSHFLSSLHASSLTNSGIASLLGGEKNFTQSDADILAVSSVLVTPRSLTPDVGLGKQV